MDEVAVVARAMRRAVTDEDKEQRRVEILAAAKRVFARKGFQATTIADVAKAAKVSYGSIYWYFDSKDELFHSLMDSEERALRTHIGEALAAITDEYAGQDLFRAAGLPHREFFDKFDIWLPRKAVHAEFFRPARLDDRLRVAAYVARLGTKSLTLNFDVLHDDGPKLSAIGWQVLVCVDRPRLKSRPLPPELVKALAPYTLSADAARAALGVTSP